MGQKSKYPYELKVKVAEYYLENTNEGYFQVAKKFNIQGAISVLLWAGIYKTHGKEGLKDLKTHIYDGKFKQDVIEYMHHNHLSYNETAIHFRIGSTTTISRWDEIYYQKGPQGLYKRKEHKKRSGKPINMNKKPKRNSREEELAAENLRLKMENEYLKNLNALVQERIKRENKKK